MNVTMATAIFAPSTLLAWAVSPSLFGTVLSIFLFGMHYLAYNMLNQRDRTTLNKYDCMTCMGWWGFGLFIAYSVTALISFFVYLPYDGQTTLGVKETLFVAQGAIVICLWVLAGLIAIFKNCHCREEWNRAVENAARRRIPNDTEPLIQTD